MAQVACVDAYNISNTYNFGNFNLAEGNVKVSSTGLNFNDTINANWFIGGNSTVNVFAALTIESGAILRVRPNAVLNIYGDVINKGYIYIHPEAKINFYGGTWYNEPTARINNGKIQYNTSDFGHIYFVAPRPAIPASINANSCILSNYSSGNFTQNIDDSNVAFFANIHIQNSNNVNIIRTRCNIAANLFFDILGGDIILENQYMTLGKISQCFWTIPNAKDAFIVTKNDSTCSSFVEKDSIRAGESFIFPIGKREIDPILGIRDFTPLIIQNDYIESDMFRVKVADYAYAQANNIQLGTPSDSTNTVWRILSNKGRSVTVNFAHSTQIGNGNTVEDFFDESGIIFQYDTISSIAKKKKGPRSIGSGIGVATRIINNSYGVDTLQSICSNNYLQWFLEKPLKLKSEVETNENFKIGNEKCGIYFSYRKEQDDQNIMAIYVEMSEDSTFQNVTTIGEMLPLQTNSYFYYLSQAQNSFGIYRLRVVLSDTSYYFSNIFTHSFVHNCYVENNSPTIFPNPTLENNSIVYIVNLKKGTLINVYHADGKLSNKYYSDENTQPLQSSQFAKGIYFIEVKNPDSKPYILKWIRL